MCIEIEIDSALFTSPKEFPYRYSSLTTGIKKALASEWILLYNVLQVKGTYE